MSNNGKWQREQPTRPGLYWMAYADGTVHDQPFRVYAASDGSTYTVGAYGRWFWSEALMQPPPAPRAE